MLGRSEVIVLGSVKYGDNSIILKAYSRQDGVISFIAGSAAARKGPLKIIMTQPLSQLEVVFYKSAKSDLKRIKEARLNPAYTSILFNPLKNCIALFLAEVLKHLLKEEERNEELFEFLSNSLLILDGLEEGISNFHLIFLYQLTALCGFKPEERNNLPYFDLLSGTYMGSDPYHTHYLQGSLLENWKILSEKKFQDLGSYRPGSENRHKLLLTLLDYYRLHLNNFGEIKSLDVLHAVLH